MNADSPSIGVVLSSGGGRGVYAHTGFLQAVQNLGVPVAVYAGCSAGAVVGGVVASGTALRNWSARIAAVRHKEFWTPDSLLRFSWQMIARHGRGYTGLSSTDAAIEFCSQNLAVQTFEECASPFYAVATDLGSGDKTVFSQGELAPRMMASAAMPVLYRPVEIEGKLYCDGALIELAPVDAICCKHKLDAVIIHHVSQQYSDEDVKAAITRPWAILEILARLLFRQRPWYLSGEELSFRRCPCHCGAVVIVLEPRLPALHWPLIEGGPQLQQAAMRQTEDLLRLYIQPLLRDPREELPDATDGHPGNG